MLYRLKEQYTDIWFDTHGEDTVIATVMDTGCLISFAHQHMFVPLRPSLSWNEKITTAGEMKELSDLVRPLFPIYKNFLEVYEDVVRSASKNMTSWQKVHGEKLVDTINEYLDEHGGEQYSPAKDKLLRSLQYMSASSDKLNYCDGEYIWHILSHIQGYSSYISTHNRQGNTYENVFEMMRNNEPLTCLHPYGHFSPIMLYEKNHRPKDCTLPMSMYSLKEMDDYTIVNIDKEGIWPFFNIHGITNENLQGNSHI